LRLLLELGEIFLLLCSSLLSLPQRIFRTASYPDGVIISERLKGEEVRV